MKIPAFARLLASVTALTLAAPALAQDNGAVTDFELPTEQATPRGDVQGPVLDGIAPPRAVRPSPTPAPTPRPVVIEPAPTTIESRPAAPSPQPAEQVRNATNNPNATVSQETQAEPQAVTPEDAGGEIAPAPTEVTAPGFSLPQPSLAESAADGTATPVSPSGGIPWWTWLAALLAVAAVGIAAGWLWRGRSQPDTELEVETIEPPRVPQRVNEPASPPAGLPKVANRPAPKAPLPQQPAPAQAIAADEEDDDEASERVLRIALEPARLSVTLLNATLAYRILLTNQGETPLRDISIDGDMISAHASLSAEEQIAASNSQLENRHLIRTLFPGETKVVSGNFALPLPSIRPIRNGDAALFVPLARLRVVASGQHNEVIVQTSVVGQRSERPGGGLQPFRLDLGPRIYSELAQRAFA